MAPEQILGFPADKSGDVFSFGILMWECLVLKRSRQMFSLEKLAIIGKSVHYKVISKLEGKKNVKLVISDCTKTASKRPTFHQVLHVLQRSFNTNCLFVIACMLYYKKFSKTISISL